MAIYEVVSGGDRQSLFKRFMHKSKMQAISELVDIHLLHCRWIEKLEAERDAALAEVERLRESKGDPVGSLEKCMKVMYERDEHAKRLEAALARVAELEKELAMARDAAAKGDAARRAAGGMEMEIQELREKVTELQKELRSRWTYASTQATNCAGCGSTNTPRCASTGWAAMSV